MYIFSLWCKILCKHSFKSFLLIRLPSLNLSYLDILKTPSLQIFQDGKLLKSAWYSKFGWTYTFSQDWKTGTIFMFPPETTKKMGVKWNIWFSGQQTSGNIGKCPSQDRKQVRWALFLAQQEWVSRLWWERGNTGGASQTPWVGKMGAKNPGRPRWLEVTGQRTKEERKTQRSTVCPPDNAAQYSLVCL